MWQRAAEGWVRMVYPERKGLMRQVEQLKDREGGILKHERYFRVIPFNEVCFEALSEVKFLPWSGTVVTCPRDVRSKCGLPKYKFRIISIDWQSTIAIRL